MEEQKIVERQVSPVEIHSFMDGAESKRENEPTKKRDGKVKFRRNGHELLQRRKRSKSRLYTLLPDPHFFVLHGLYLGGASPPIRGFPRVSYITLTHFRVKNF